MILNGAISKVQRKGRSLFGIPLLIYGKKSAKMSVTVHFSGLFFCIADVCSIFAGFVLKQAEVDFIGFELTIFLDACAAAVY